jgi:pilus assembly protein Flp/PilA
MEANLMRNLVRDFAGNQSGATAIEYALIASGIALAIVLVVRNIGTTLNATFTTVQNAFK